MNPAGSGYNINSGESSRAKDLRMADFIQNGLVTTLHDLGSVDGDRLDSLLHRATRNAPIGLILPVTAADMRKKPFADIVDELTSVAYLQRIVVVLDAAEEEEAYRQAKLLVDPLGERVKVIWNNGPRMHTLYESLKEAGLKVGIPGKGQAVWAAIGYLLGESNLKAFTVHDCDIVDYRREMLARLCLPMCHPSLDFEFCKAYYARVTKRMHGRVVRLLVAPLLRALISSRGYDCFLVYLNSFRYPLSGEFGISSTLARAIRIPGDWGLEIGTLAEVFRNTSIKRVAQVDLCQSYEHKHKSLSLGDPSQGLMKMATDILTTLFRTLASMGMVFHAGDFLTLRSAYLREAQDSIRQYRADALMNGLQFDQHEEEQTVEAFAQRIVAAGHQFRDDPAGGDELPNWSRVLSIFPEFPERLHDTVEADAEDFVRRASTGTYA